MIKGFEQETEKLSSDEIMLMELIVELLKGHVGASSAISGSQIKSMILDSQHVVVTGVRIRKIINHIRIHSLVPLLCANNNGYYVAKSLDDALAYCASLESRIEAQQNVVRQLKNQIYHKRIGSLYKPKQEKLDL